MWTFTNTFLFISSFLNKRQQTEVDNFFEELFDTPYHKRIATSSSFTQSRSKISHLAFVDAGRQLTEYYYKNFCTKRYCGMRLVAVDGSVLTAPKNEETKKEFGDNVFGNGKWVKIQASFATDVLSNVCLDAKIGPYKECGRVLAAKHMAKLGSGNLYIFDRGYYSLDLLKTVQLSGNDYCFRLKSDAFKKVSAFLKSEKTDVIIPVALDCVEITVRLTKVVLDTGEIEILLTSLLDTERFKIRNLKKLYHMRWGVEEQYKDMKYTVHIENFLGKKVNSIKQGFFATVMTYSYRIIFTSVLN